MIFGLLVVESRIGGPRDSLKRLFSIIDRLDVVVSERATALEGGEHPKHRLTRYHDFFVDRIAPGSRVLDIGCGYGAVARSIARRVEGAEVLGIDFSTANIDQARANDNPPNIRFIAGDALVDLPEGPWDTIVLSNVLEHIDERVPFLRRLVDTVAPKSILIRVPLFERHWHLPMRRELGVNYFSDPTHHIEHTLAEFDDEIGRSGLALIERQTLWGEIWAHCRPEGAS